MTTEPKASVTKQGVKNLNDLGPKRPRKERQELPPIREEDLVPADGDFRLHR